MFGSCAANMTAKNEELPNATKPTPTATFNLRGLSPEGFIKQYSGLGEEIDISLLAADFKNFCYDFEESTYDNTASLATEFCNKIIFDVGPESKLRNSNENNMEWRFVFPTKQNSSVKRYVLVCKDKSMYTKCSDDTLVLTVTQASLLALLTFGRLIEISVRKPEPVYLLTPLAAAIFPKTNLTRLLSGSKLIDPQMDMAQLLKIINYSCQPGGQCLPESRADCAAVASIIATRYIKNKNFQHETIRKTLKKYINIGKTIDQQYFRLYAVHAAGEIPADLEYASLIKIINKQ